MSGREIIARQRALIERCSLLGYDTSWFEESPSLFELSNLLRARLG